MQNAIILLIVGLVLSWLIPNPLYAKITLNSAVLMVIGMLIKEQRKEKDKGKKNA